VKESSKSSVTLTWTAPTEDGGSPITSYIVEARAEGAFKWKRVTEDTIPSTTYTVKGLQEKTLYDFRVSAENRAGVGPASEGAMAVKVEEKICELSTCNK